MPAATASATSVPLKAKESPVEQKASVKSVAPPIMQPLTVESLVAGLTRPGVQQPPVVDSPKAQPQPPPVMDSPEAHSQSPTVPKPGNDAYCTKLCQLCLSHHYSWVRHLSIRVLYRRKHLCREHIRNLRNLPEKGRGLHLRSLPEKRRRLQAHQD